MKYFLCCLLLSPLCVFSYVVQTSLIENDHTDAFPPTILFLGDAHDRFESNEGLEKEHDLSFKELLETEKGVFFLSEYSPRYNPVSASYIYRLNVRLRAKKNPPYVVVDTDDIRKKFVKTLLRADELEKLMLGRTSFITNNPESFAKRLCSHYFKKGWFSSLKTPFPKKYYSSKTISFYVEGFDIWMERFCQKSEEEKAELTYNHFLHLLMGMANIEILYNLHQCKSKERRDDDVAVVYFGSSHISYGPSSPDEGEDRPFLPSIVYGVRSVLMKDFFYKLRLEKDGL